MTEEQVQSLIRAIEPLLLFIFSWIIMLPMGVIISGIFLGSLVVPQTASGTRFRIPLLILNIEAAREQVVAGFFAYMLTLAFVLLLGGPQLYEFLKEKAGVDPGHFNTLCVASSFLSAIWTFIPFLLHTVLLKSKGIAPRSHPDALSRLETTPPRPR